MIGCLIIFTSERMPSEAFFPGFRRHFLLDVSTVNLRAFFDELDRFFLHTLPLGFLLVGVVA